MIEHNNDGALAGDIEYSVICKLYRLKIILFKKGYTGLNLYNIYSTDNYNKENFKTLFILFVDNNHFNYLKILNSNNKNIQEIYETIDRLICNNLKEWENIRKKITLFL